MTEIIITLIQFKDGCDLELSEIADLIIARLNESLSSHIHDHIFNIEVKQ